MPPPKHERVVQACSRCRLKKIKCDGKTPTCSICQKACAECEYGTLKRRSKGKTREYVSSLQQRLERMEEQLRLASETGALQTQRPVEAVTTAEPCALHRPFLHSEQSGSPDEHDMQSENPQTRPPLSGPIPRQVPPLIEQPEAVHLSDLFLDEINDTLLLFQRLPVLAKFRLRYPHDRNSQDPAWWASIHAILAMATQHKANAEAASAHDPYRRDALSFSWVLCQDAYSAFSDIASAAPAPLGVQALLAVAYFLSGSADTTTTALLTTSAVRVILLLEPDKDPLVTPGSLGLLFWVTFVLDVDSSIHAGLPRNLDGTEFHTEFPIVRLCPTSETTECHQYSLFLMKVELYRIRAKVYDFLLRATPTTSPSEALVAEWAELEKALFSWGEKYPLDMALVERDRSRSTGDRKDGSNSDCKVTSGPQRRHLLMLHIVLYNSLSMLYDTMAGSVSDPFADPRPDSRHFCKAFLGSRACAARSLADLVLNAEFPFIADLGERRALPYILCSCITLLAAVIEDSAGPYTSLDINRLEAMSNFIQTLQKETGYDLERFRTGCQGLEGLAKVVVAKATGSVPVEDPVFALFQDVSDDALEAITLKLKTASHALLAHGLLGNSPRLVKGASDVFEAVFGDIFPHWKLESGRYGWLAPQSLRPDTYGFGVKQAGEAAAAS